MNNITAKTIFFFMMIGLLTGCNDSGSVLDNSSKSIDNDDVNSIIIEIPNNTNTSGMFDQIIWSGTGGGAIDRSINCDNCRLSSSGFGDDIELSGFEPNQQVNLIFYRMFEGDCFSFIGKFVAVYTVQVNKNGNLYINMSGYDSETFVYMVSDTKSGILLWQRVLALQDSECIANSQDAIIGKYSCGGNISTNMSIGDNGQITYSTGEPVRLREEPKLSAKILKSYGEGTKLRVINGPACNDGYVWWYIEISSQKGWMANGTSSNWFIEPLP